MIDFSLESIFKRFLFESCLITVSLFILGNHKTISCVAHASMCYISAIICNNFNQRSKIRDPESET